MSSALSFAIVVPIKDKATVAANCLRSIAAAAVAAPGTTVVVVDHDSSDGTYEIAQEVSSGAFPVMRLRGGHVGRVRNVGAAACESDWLVFIDGDCVIPGDFIARLRRVIEERQVAVAGCEVGLPLDPNWIEASWDAITHVEFEGDVRWLNSACFAVRRDEFNRIRGFDETRVSGEDVDICERLKANGLVLWQSPTLQVEHHGNPQSISGFYRRLRWHGEGFLDASGAIQYSATIFLVLAHALALTVAVAASLLVLVGVAVPFALLFCVLPLGVPTLLFARGIIRTRNLRYVVQGYVLMHLALLARVHGMVRVLCRHLRSPVLRSA